MNILDAIGALSGLMFFLKIFIHLFIKLRVDKEFDFATLTPSSGPFSFFFPIWDDVNGGLKLLKKIGNTIYVISILLFVICFIGFNLHL